MLNNEDFDRSMKFVLDHEGKYSNNPNDKGGPTNYGISTVFYEKNKDEIKEHFGFTVKDVKFLTKEQAIKIYRYFFWERYKYAYINNVAIAAKLFDMCVNMGPYQAHLIAQRAVDEVSNLRIICDGIIGPITIAGINAVINNVAEKAYINQLKKDCANFYSTIANNAGQSIFLKTWLARANDSLT